MTAPFDDLIRAALAEPDRRRRLAEVIQSGLVASGYDLGSSGPARDGVDGVPGPLTLAALAEALSPPVVEGEPWDDLDRLDAALAAVAPTLHDSERTEWVAHLSTAAARWGIDTPARLAMWLAQLAHESAGFTRLVESLSYSSAERIRDVWPSRFPTVESAEPFVRDPVKLAARVYDNRTDLGNNRPGDGYTYRGRGLIQITGRANYAAAPNAGSVALVDAPELAAEPAVAAMVAGWFWESRRLNRFADAADLWGCTRAITGAPNTTAAMQGTGFAGRQRLWDAATAALEVAT